MANEFSRNLKDLATKVTRALPTADGTVTSSDIDLGPNTYDFSPENVELEIALPALTSTHLPSADTLTITVQAGDSASPTTTTGLTKVVTGTGSTIAAQNIRFRLPSDIGRYLNVKFVAAGGTGDISGQTATINLLY